MAPSIVPTVSVEPEEEYKPQDELYQMEITETMAPESFEVAALATADVPAPDAKTQSKRKLFIDSIIFRNVDSHALEASQIMKSTTVS